jgi:hypothetical protein
MVLESRSVYGADVRRPCTWETGCGQPARVLEHKVSGRTMTVRESSIRLLIGPRHLRQYPIEQDVRGRNAHVGVHIAAPLACACRDSVLCAHDVSGRADNSPITLTIQSCSLVARMGTSKPSVVETNVSQSAGSKALLTIVGRMRRAMRGASRRARGPCRCRPALRGCSSPHAG